MRGNIRQNFRREISELFMKVSTDEKGRPRMDTFEDGSEKHNRRGRGERRTSQESCGA